jgi:hypothetical protein
MKKQFILALVVVFSWTASNFFSIGIDDLLYKYVDSTHRQALVHFGVAFLFMLLIVYFGVEDK